jgi:membrane protease YdiL (CAAX protease family)
VTDETWRTSRWGLGQLGWSVLAYLGAGSLGLIVLVLIGVGEPDDELGPMTVSLFVVLNAVPFVLVPWLATRRQGVASLSRDFGLNASWRSVGIGLAVGVVALFAAGAARLAIDTLLGVDDQTSNIPVDELTSTSDFLVFFASTAIVTPVIEELFFRGLVYRSFVKRGASTARAMAWTTLIFVAPHLPAVDDWRNVASLFATIAVLGLAFNLACHWCGNSLGGAIVAHAVVNGTAVVALWLS